MEPTEPTADQCSARARVDLPDGTPAWACWYPTMGGYAGRAVVVRDDGATCVGVYVWHNGDFPFAGSGPPWPGDPVPSPAELHHCDGGQFIAFGEFLLAIQNGRATTTPPSGGERSDTQKDLPS